MLKLMFCHHILLPFQPVPVIFLADNIQKFLFTKCNGQKFKEIIRTEIS